jgi:hypothetical protein
LLTTPRVIQGNGTCRAEFVNPSNVTVRTKLLIIETSILGSVCARESPLLNGSTCVAAVAEQ